MTQRAETLRAAAARLVHVFRTTTFKLTLVYLAVFAVAVLFLLAYFAWNTNRLITEQIQETVDAEITGLTDQYRLSGIRRLVLVIQGRAQRPGSNLYLVTTFTGEALAGNVGSLSPGVLDRRGWVETAYRRLDEGEGAEHRALARVEQLPGGFRLLVGRDLDEREHLLDIVFSALRWLIGLLVVLGLAGGLFVTRRVLRRVDAMTGTTQTIMAGDLGGRLPIAGTGDEIVLQPREFRLLEYLMKHAGQVVTRTMLLENVWDYHFDPQTNVIDVHMSRLRSKIDKGYARPLLHTVRGAGYMIRDGAR